MAAACDTAPPAAAADRRSIGTGLLWCQGLLRWA